MYTVLCRIRKSLRLLPISVALLVALSGCENSTSDVVSKSFGYGKLLDSAVQGVSYASDERTGLTGAGGEYSYVKGVPVRFSIGGIELGRIDARNIVTPIQLGGGSLPSDDAVSNIASFLQTLDDDGDPSNGIFISKSVRGLAANMSVDFSQSKSAFAQDVKIQTIVSTLTSATTAGARNLVMNSDAETHLSNNLLSLLANSMGTYYGKFKIARTCSDPSYSGSTDLSGDMRFTLGVVGTQTVSFSSTGSFSFSEGGATLRMDLAMNTASQNTISTNGEVAGVATTSIYVNDIFDSSGSSSYKGTLDGDNMLLKFPDKNNLPIAGTNVVCDTQGSLIDLKKL